MDLLDVSIMTYASTEYMSANGAVPNGYNQFATEKIRQNISIPVIAVGRIVGAMGEDMVRTGQGGLHRHWPGFPGRPGAAQQAEGGPLGGNLPLYQLHTILFGIYPQR